MKTAVRAAKRIWSRYWRKAVRLPIGSSPVSTRIAPNQRTATVERLKIAKISGLVIAKIRPACSWSSNRSRLADSNRVLLVTRSGRRPG